MPAETLRERLWATPKSKETSPEMPKSFASWLKVWDLSVLQQCLGRDAAYVEADTTPVLLLDYGNFLTKLSCTDGGHVAARARAEYYYVIMFISHAL